MTQQDKPMPATAGETWTRAKVYELMMSQEDDWLAYEAVVDAHNAALAAEREAKEKWRRNYTTILEDRRQLRSQLQTNQQELTAVENTLKCYRDALNNHKHDLAAAQASLQWYARATYPDDGSGRPPKAFQRRAMEALNDDTSCLDATIAEATKPLVAMLQWIRSELFNKGGDSYLVEALDAALAKYREGKQKALKTSGHAA